ncbi:MAG: sensor histidine kinase [Acidothermaceae bacterium]
MWQKLRLDRADAVLAAVLVVLAVLEVTLNTRIQPKPAAYAVEIGIAAAVVWRRTAPIFASVIAATLGVALVTSGVPLEEPIVDLLAFVVIGYSLSSYAPMPVGLTGTALLLTSGGIQTAVAHKGFSNFAFAFVFLAAMWLMGLTVRRRTARAVHLELAAADFQRQRDDEMRRSAADERLRIARELHDVVSHSLTVMVVQADAAEQVLARDPARAAEPLRSVQRVGREALGEMARLLGILRDGGEELGLAPAPGISELPQLIRQARDAGLDVDACIDLGDRPLPGGVGLTVYRIVQEALTNAAKHAGAVPVRVRVGIEEDQLNVEVADRGGRVRAPSGGGHGGHGLVGMRERVAVYAGSLEAGPAPDGGFAVRARIPVLVVE